MGISGLSALGAALGGIGGFAGGTASALEEQRKEALAQQKLDEERQYRDAQITLERDKLAQTGPIDFSALPAPLRAIVDPQMMGGKLDTRMLPAIVEQGKLAQQRSLGGQAANALEAQFPPNDVQGPTRSGEPIGLQPTMPANISALLPFLRSGLVEKPAEMLAQAFPKPEMRDVVDPDTGRTYTQPFNPMTGAPVPGGAQSLKQMGPMELLAFLKKGDQAPAGTGAPRVDFVPSIGDKGVTFKGDPEPPNYQYIRGMLADAGWQPGMKGYDTEFATQLQQPVPIAPGGKATSRSEGIRPPSFYGNSVGPGGVPGASGTGGAPAADTPGNGASTPRWRGDPATVPDVAAKEVSMAVQMRRAANEIGQSLKDPTTADYIGPYAQYREGIQGKAPNEMLGKIPPAVVQLDQNLHALQNYMIRLITGAQMNKDEVPRIMGQLPQRGNQADEFRQRLRSSMDNVSMMENQIRALALQGDTNAKAAQAELGLDRMREIQVPAAGTPPIEINRNATVMPKLPPGARREGNDIISESGAYVWRGGQWQPR